MSSASLNRVTLIGNLGQEPEFKSTANAEFCIFSLATTEQWRDRKTNSPVSRTEWHRVVVFNEALVKVIRQYVHKGMRVMVEGKLQTRNWKTDSGETRYTTEVVLSGFDSRFMMLGGRGSDSRAIDSAPAGNPQDKLIPTQKPTLSQGEDWELDEPPF